jgi:hypothetical protein
MRQTLTRGYTIGGAWRRDLAHKAKDVSDGPISTIVR